MPCLTRKSRREGLFSWVNFWGNFKDCYGGSFLGNLGENDAMNTAAPSLEEETVSICQDLIRIPSVNYGEGKGDEKAVAEYVVASLAEVGITA